MGNNLFVCEKCGGVAPDDCLKCPDRGHGRGVTVQKIKDDLRACRKNAELGVCRTHYGRHIATLRREGGMAGVMALQIENLVRYRRMVILERWGN